LEKIYHVGGIPPGYNCSIGSFPRLLSSEEEEAGIKNLYKSIYVQPGLPYPGHPPNFSFTSISFLPASASAAGGAEGLKTTAKAFKISVIKLLIII
jgi:hypothetical protein